MLGQGRHEEATAGAVITPGMLVALSAVVAAAVNQQTVVPHSVAGGPAEMMFALEDALQGRTIRDNYAVGELVGIVMAEKGDVVYAFLAAGESVDAGDQLASDGAGALEPAASGTPIAVALEAVDLSDTDAEVDNRIRVRVI